MRPSAKNRHETAPQKPAKKSSPWRRQGAALMASLGLMTPMAATPANANAMSHDPLTSESLIRMRGDNCQNMVNPMTPLPALAPAFARVSEGFTRLQALPITGAPIMASLNNGAHRFQVCLDQNLPGMNGILAAYSPSQNRLYLPQNQFNFISTAHEAYHAHQDALGGLSTARLHPRDVLIAHLLTEASAAAYTVMVMREMAFYSDADAAAYQAHIANPRNAYGQGRTFDAAFEAAYARHADLPEDQRRRRALEAGGQAVVSGLMAGTGENWRRGYAARAATASSISNSEADRTSRRYQHERAEIFQRMGRVGSDIQIVPAPFYGANADANAEASLMILGIEVFDVPAAPPIPRGPRR